MSIPEDVPTSQSTIDFADGQLHILQPSKGFGFRACTDSFLLAAAIDPSFSGTAIEFGCGSGAVMLAALATHPHMTVVGVEIDETIVNIAQKNIVLNNFADRATIVNANCIHFPSTPEDIKTDAQNEAKGKALFDLVFSNPPYYAPHKYTHPKHDRTTAHLTMDETGKSFSIGVWVKAMVKTLKHKGIFLMINRAENANDIAIALKSYGMGEITFLPIYGKPNHDAKLVIIRARKSVKGKDTFLFPICVRDDNDKQTTMITKILNGTLSLTF